MKLRLRFTSKVTIYMYHFLICAINCCLIDLLSSPKCDLCFRQYNQLLKFSGIYRYSMQQMPDVQDVAGMSEEPQHRKIH